MSGATPLTVSKRPTKRKWVLPSARRTLHRSRRSFRADGRKEHALPVIVPPSSRARIHPQTRVPRRQNAADPPRKTGTRPYVRYQTQCPHRIGNARFLLHLAGKLRRNRQRAKHASMPYCSDPLERGGAVLSQAQELEHVARMPEARSRNRLASPAQRKRSTMMPRFSFVPVLSGVCTTTVCPRASSARAKSGRRRPGNLPRYAEMPG